MPIVGMTRREDVIPRIPNLGKLRKGGPKTDPKRPGPDLEYWRFTSEIPGVEAAFYAAYPNNPRSIEAYLPFAKMEDNWHTWHEEWDHGGLVHRCDGQTMYRWRLSDGSYRDGERPCPYADGTQKRTKETPGCKQVGRLYLIIPALIKAGHVGFVTMETHSVHDLVSITACLLDIERRAGGLNGILMSIMRIPQVISTPAWDEKAKAAGKRNRTTKWLVRVVPAAEWVQAQLARQHDEAMALAAGDALRLAAPAQDENAESASEYDDDDNNDVVDAESDTRGNADAVAADRAQQIIQRLRTNGASDSRPIDEDTRKKLWGHLSTLTGKNESRAKELIAKVYGVTHTSQLTMGQAGALIGWIAAKPIRDENGNIDAWAPTGPAMNASEYEALFPPEPGLFDDQEAQQ